MRTEPGSDERLIGPPVAAFVFAATVFGATALQVLAVPVVAYFEGDAEWPLSISIPVAIVLLALACAIQAGSLAFSDKAPEVAVVVSTLVYLVVLIGFSVPAWLVGMKLVITLALFLLATRRRSVIATVWLVGVVAPTVVTIYLWTQSLGIQPAVAGLCRFRRDELRCSRGRRHSAGSVVGRTPAPFDACSLEGGTGRTRTRAAGRARPGT